MQLTVGHVCCPTRFHPLYYRAISDNPSREQNPKICLHALYACFLGKRCIGCVAMNVRFLTAIFAGATLATAGVAAAQVTSAQQTGYLQDYHRLGHVGGVPL